jgi:hypothetical protein
MIGQALGGTPLGFEPQDSFVSITITPTGVVGNGAVGAFVPLVAPGDVNDQFDSDFDPIFGNNGGVTGVLATASSGSVSHIQAPNVSGTSATGSVATLSDHLSITLSGTVATGRTGALGEAIGGVSASARVGTLAATISSLPISITASGAVGNISIGLSAFLSGNAASGRMGSLSFTPVVTLSGVAAIASNGITNSNTFVFPMGVVASAILGIPTATNIVALSIANIHIGLSAWTTGSTYHPGDRVSKSGIAYQCITTGVSGTGPTGTGSNILDGTAHWMWLSAIDFTNTQSWANSIPSVLSQPYVGLMWNDGAINITDTTQPYLSLSGHTTSSTNNITLTCAAGESIRDQLASNTLAFSFNSTKGVSFVLPNAVGNQNYFNIVDGNVIFDGLQFADPSSISGSTIVRGGAATALTLRNCIFDGYAQNGIIVGSVVQMSNCLVVDRTAQPPSATLGEEILGLQGSIDGAYAVYATTSVSYAVNCTFISINSSINIGAAGFVGNGYARNCIFSGYLNGTSGVAGITPLADHCVFTASTVGLGATNNGNNIFNQAASNQFISPTSDFRLIYASAALNAASTDLTDLPADTDIAKTPRPQGSAWDIGAWELVPLATGAGVAAIALAGQLLANVLGRTSGTVGSTSVGTLIAMTGINASVTLAGTSAIGLAGNLSLSLQAIPVGISGFGQTGNPSLSYPATATMIGVTATSGTGTFAFSLFAQPLGITAATAVGTVSLLSNIVLLSTIIASASAGVLTAIPFGTPLIGLSTTGLAGLFGLISTLTIGGISGQGSVGSAIGLVSPVIVGTPAIGLSGNLTTISAYNQNANVTGISANGAVSTFSYSLFGFISGSSGLALSGSIVTALPGFVSLAGLAAFALFGTLTITSQINILGIVASGNVGSVAENPQARVIGVTGAGSVGIAAKSVLALPSGLITTGFAGRFGTSPTLAGISAAASVGSLRGSAISIRSISAAGLAGTIASTTVVSGLISNIHFGLTAWQTATGYLIGNRVSHGGNAYQCIGAGTSSAGPSGTASSISDGTATFKFLSAIDFTTIQSWANAIPASLTTPIVGQLWNDGAITTTAGTPFLNLFGHSTTFANSIVLTCAPGESFRDTLANRSTAFAFNVNNGVALVLPSTAGNTNYFDITDANVIIDGLQIQDPCSTSNSTIIQTEIGSTSCIVQHCILDGYAQPGNASLIECHDQFILRDSLIIDRQISSGTGVAISTVAGVGSIFINNTIVNVGSSNEFTPDFTTQFGSLLNILGNTSGAALVCNSTVDEWATVFSNDFGPANSSSIIAINRNNYWIGWSTPIIGSGGAVVPSDHCCFSQASLSYTNSTISDSGNNLVNAALVNQFISTSDFRTTYASSGLDRASTDITDLPALQDISRVARPQGAAWDVGAWELSPLVSANAAAGIVGSLSNFISSGNAIPTGSFVTGSVGNLALILAARITGITTSSFAGNLTTSLTASVTGRFSTAQVGALGATSFGFVSGVNGTASVGSPSVISISALPLGVVAFASCAFISAVGGSFATTLGSIGNGQSGLLSTSLTYAISGVIATASAGIALAQSGGLASGIVATGQASLVQLITTQLPLGISASGQTGTLLASEFVSIGGIAGLGLSGTVVGAPYTLSVVANGQNGALITQITVIMIGRGAAGSVGSLSLLLQSSLLTGVVTNGTSGLIVPTIPGSIVGTAASASIGTIIPAPKAILGGIVTTGLSGSVVVQTSSTGIINLAGIFALAQLGSLIPQSSPTTLLGVSAIGARAIFALGLFAIPLGVTATALIATFGLLSTTNIGGSVAIGGVGLLAGLPTPFVSSISASAIFGTLGILETLNALVGISAAASIGNLTSPQLQGVSGVSALASRGSLISLFTIGITGTAASSLAGSLSGSMVSKPAILGVNGTGGFASLLTQDTTAFTGLVATAFLGSVIAATIMTPLGVSASAQIAALAQIILVTDNGVHASGLNGSVSQTAPNLLAGISASAAIGSLTLLSLSAPIGVSALAVGSLPSHLSLIGLIGSSSTTAIGLLAETGRALPIGVSGIVTSGTFALGVTLASIGWVANGLPGTFIPNRLTTILGVMGFGNNGSLSQLKLANNLFGVVAIGSPAFRRASIASYVDSAGVLQIAGVDVQRITHGPNAPFPSLGVLLEAASSNLNPQSNMVGWSARSAALSTGYSAPDDTATALFVQSTVGTNINNAFYQWGGSPSTTYTHSVYAKANGYNYLHMQTWDFGIGGNSGIEAWFDLGNGVVVSASNAGPQSSGATASISIGPNGFYRCVLTGIAATNASLALQSVLQLSINGADNSITGDAVSGILVWGDQIEASSFASSYIPTAGSIATRAADIPIQIFSFSSEQPSLTGCIGIGSTGSLSAAPFNTLIGLIALGQTATVSVTVGAMPLGIVAHGQNATLLAVIEQSSVIGVATIASVGSLVPQVLNLPIGLIASGTVGNLAKTEIVSLLSASGTALVGTCVPQIAALLLGSSAIATSGSLALSGQAQLIGIASIGLAGNCTAGLTILSTGLVGSALSGILVPVELLIASSIIGSGSVGKIIAKTAITPLGMAGSAVAGSLSAILSVSLSASAAQGLVGQCSSITTILPLGCVAITQAGTVSFTYLVAMVGTIGTGQTGTLAAQLFAITAGSTAIGQTGTLKLSSAAGVAGLTATAGCGSFTVQAAVFPSGIAATATSGALIAQSAAIMVGVVASSAAGIIPHVQLFALPIGCASAGMAGNIVGQTMYVLTGRAANASAGALSVIDSALTIGLVAHGASGGLTTRLVGTPLVGQAANGKIGSPIAQTTAIFPQSVVASGRVGHVTLQSAASPIGVAAIGIAGITRGWLIIINVASTLPIVLARALVTAGTVMDELPMEVDVYSVAQVIQLVYPVKGLHVDVYSIPQLVNTVVNDG